MHRRLGWLFVVAPTVVALLVVPAATADDREKGPRERAAEARIAANQTAPQLIGYLALGKGDAREAGVAEEIVAHLPFKSEALPLVPSRIESTPTRTTQSRKRITAWAGCWQATWRRGGGTWPYHRDVYQETTWCTTMQNTVGTFFGRSWPHSDYGCAPNYGPTYHRVGGGVGISSVDVETRGGFSCNVYWYGLQTWVWMVPRFYGDGRTAMAGWGQ